MKHLVLAGVLFFGAAAAHAQFYVGASLASIDDFIEVENRSVQSDDSAWKAYAGFNLLEFLGAEVSYRDYGHFSSSSISLSADADIKIIDGSVRAFFPIFVLDGFVKAGYAHIATDGAIRVNADLTEFDEADWELFYGVGAEFNLTSQLAVRGEWESFQNAGGLSSLSFGLNYRF